jgi:hypothetical protein
VAGAAEGVISKISISVPNISDNHIIIVGQLNYLIRTSKKLETIFIQHQNISIVFGYCVTLINGNNFFNFLNIKFPFEIMK